MGVPPLLFGPPPHRLSPLLFAVLSRWPRQPRRRWLASGRRTPSPAGPCPLMSPSTSKGHVRGHPRALILGAAPAPACVSSGTSGQLGGAAHPQVPRRVVKTQFYSRGVLRMGFLSPPRAVPLPLWGKDVFLGPLLSLFHIPSLSSGSGCPPHAPLSPKPFSASCPTPLELSSSPSPGRASALCHSQAASANSPGSPPLAGAGFLE